MRRPSLESLAQDTLAVRDQIWRQIAGAPNVLAYHELSHISWLTNGDFAEGATSLLQSYPALQHFTILPRCTSWEFARFAQRFLVA